MSKLRDKIIQERGCTDGTDNQGFLDKQQNSLTAHKIFRHIRANPPDPGYSCSKNHSVKMAVSLSLFSFFLSLSP
jgi:hypothetical protein